MSSQSSFHVELVVYDLSQGMARAMSAQLLGPEHAIDMIPHTAILVYGKEYFFGAGAGISVEDPHVFRRTRGLYPIDTIRLGSTSVPQTQFEDWCVQQMNENNGPYSKFSYDLFRRNCNNFSHDAALKGLRLREGVPSHILEVPDRFLRSPMGQAMAPMLQGMQVSGGIPFVPTATATTSCTPGTTKPAADTTAVQENNPWANLGTTSITSTAPTAETSTITDDSGCKPPAPTSSKPKMPPNTPFIDTNSRPLLSNDTKTVVICANKFDHDAIREVAKLIYNSKSVSSCILEQACDALLSYLVQDHQITFGLMLLRVLVLNDTFTTTAKDTPGATTKCVEWTKAQLQTNHNSKLTDPAKCMAWCCLSNIMSSTTRDSTATPHVDMLEYALRDVTTSSRPEVKQSAASFLYNLALSVCGADEHKNNDKKGSASVGEVHLSDSLVSLLCGSMEAIHEEKDVTTLTRRLLVVAHIIKQHKPTAVQLTIDLGFDDLLKSLQQHSNTNDDVETLRQEILALVDFHR